jgi:O-antigen ligase
MRGGVRPGPEDPVAGRGAQPTFMHNISSFILLAALFLAPFGNGAVNDWAWGIVATAVALAVTGAAIQLRRSSLPGRIPARRAAYAWWGLFALVALLQIVPLPAAILQLVAPARAELARTVADVTSDDASHNPGVPSPVPPTPVSVNTEATELALAQIATLGLLFWFMASGRRTSRRIRLDPLQMTGGRHRIKDPPASGADPFLTAFVLTATIQAAILLVQYAARVAGNAGDLPTALAGAAGTYVNKNGAGNLVAIALPVTAGLFLETFRLHSRARHDGRHSRQPLLVRLGKGGVFWLAAALAIQMAGVVLSLSRGATAAAGAALAALLLAAGIRFRAVAGSLAAWAVPVLVAFTLGSLLGLDRLLGAWAALDMDQQTSRVEWWGTAWRVFRASPVLGAGMGGFLDAQGAHRLPDQAMMHVEHAHNDYAEALAVLGIPGALLVAAALALVALSAARALRQGSLRRLGLAAALMAFALHAFVDFPSAYGANVAWAVAIWGMLAGRRSRTSEGAPSRRSPENRDPAQESRLADERRLRAIQARARLLRFLPRVALPLAAAAAVVPPIRAALCDFGLTDIRTATREIRETGALPAAAGKTGEAWRGAFAKLIGDAEDATADPYRVGEAWRCLGTILRARAAGGPAAGIPPEETAHTLRRAASCTGMAIRIRPAVGDVYAEHATALREAARSGALPATAVARADRAMTAAARLAPAAPRVALGEGIYWILRAQDDAAERDTRGGTDEAGTETAEKLKRSQRAYQRLLSLGGVADPWRFLRDAWRRSGSMDFMIGCIPAGAGERTARCWSEAEKGVAAEGRVDEMMRWDEAQRRWKGMYPGP